MVAIVVVVIVVGVVLSAASAVAVVIISIIRACHFSCITPLEHFLAGAVTNILTVSCTQTILSLTPVRFRHCLSKMNYLQADVDISLDKVFDVRLHVKLDKSVWRICG